MACAIGIDLGTTNSCVAVFKNGEINVIEDEGHKRRTPSFVFYDKDCITVGQLAIDHSVLKPANGIFDIKRLIGRKFDDPYVQENLKKWPFQVIKEDLNEPVIKLEQNGEKVSLRPEVVCAEILKKLKDDTEKIIEEEIEDVVITVPAYFTYSQKVATEHAAKIAGLNVLKLIPEPTAAALAFFQETNQNKSNQTILVYDLGGGTFDVSVVKFDGLVGEVLTVDGNSHLGGRDFDNNLMKYFTEKIDEIYKYKLVEQKPNVQRHALRRLKIQCEKVKIQLTASEKVKFTIDEFYGNDIDIDITRSKFEELNMDLFQKTIKITDNIFKRIKLKKSEIDDIVLVGGSTRIPKIRQMIQEYFDGKSLSKRVNPDEAVAIGAALQASKFLVQPQKKEYCTLKDVVPFSIGIEVVDNGDGRTMSVIIKKDSEIPAIGVKKYFTSRNNQTKFDLRIFEGQSKKVKHNTALGKLEIKGITPKKAGKVEIAISFYVNLNGILNISATETSERITKTLDINLNDARLTHEEIMKIKAAKITQEIKLHHQQLNVPDNRI